MSENILKRILQPKGKGRVWRNFILILLLVLAAVTVVFGNSYNSFIAKKGWKLPEVKNVPFMLGLDLVGGTQLTYQADVSAIAQADKAMSVEGARDVIEKRVNAFGVSEPLVQVNRGADGNYKIIVELAGVKDINEAIKKIGETPLLEFKEENNNKRDLTAAEKKDLDAFNKKAETKSKEVTSKIKTDKFFDLAKKYSEDDKTKDKGGDLGWITAKDNVELATISDKLKKGDIATAAKISSGYEFVKLNDSRVKKGKDNKEEKEVKASHLLICYKGIEGCTSGLSKEEAYAKIKKLKASATEKNFKDLIKQNSTDAGTRDSLGQLGWFSKGSMVKPFEDAVFAQAKNTFSYIIETQFGYHLVYKEDERTVKEYNISHIFIKTKSKEDILGPQGEWKNTELTGKNLKKAVVQFDSRDNTPQVSLEFDEEGSKMFEKITERNTGKPVAIFLDNYIISAPNVNEKIIGGKAVISGSFDVTEAKTLAKRLNSGALPVPINLVNQQTVGASLGQDSVDSSMKAALIGLLVVAVLMIIYYRLPGLISVFALGVYCALLLAIFKLWPVTITLSGIAGFALSVGVAIDANILIFERMREEFRKGKSLTTSINEGFTRAWPSIWDGNINTVIVCLVLIIFSTSVIKGFAITLLFGVLISMFCAITVTRNFLKLIPESWFEKNTWLLGGKRK